MKYFIAALSTIALSFAFAGTASAHPVHYKRAIIYKPAPILVAAPPVCTPAIVAAPPVVEVFPRPAHFYRGHWGRR